MHVGQCWHRPAIDHRQQMFSYFPRSPHPASHISLISTAHLVSTSNRESGSSGLKNIDINCSLGCQDRNRNWNWNKTINWLAALSVNSIWWSRFVLFGIIKVRSNLNPSNPPFYALANWTTGQSSSRFLVGLLRSNALLYHNWVHKCAAATDIGINA